MPSKFTILVDMDDVLEQLLKAWCAWLNKEHGLDITEEMCVNWDMTKNFTSLKQPQIFAPLSKEEFWKTVEPMPGAQEAIKELQSRGHEIYVVTATYPNTVKAKFNGVMKKYFKMIPADHFFVVHNKQMVTGDVIIDDNPINLGGDRLLSILYSRPHNAEFDTEGNEYFRADSWQDVLKIIKIAEEIEVD